MKTNINYILALFILCFVGGCGEEKVETASIKIPLYRQCIEPVNDYENYIEDNFQNSRYKIKLEIEYFDKLSSVHSSIIGYLIISSFWSGTTEAGFTPLESLEVEANSIMAECFPESRFTFNLNNTNLSNVQNFIRDNELAGIREHYLSLNGNELDVYFNDGNYKLPK